MIEKAAAGPRSNCPSAILTRSIDRKVVALPGPPPVTRSDWVIADNTGAIYVTGPYPPGCLPPGQGIGKEIKISATVKVNQTGAVYLQMQ